MPICKKCKRVIKEGETVYGVTKGIVKREEDEVLACASMNKDCGPFCTKCGDQLKLSHFDF